MNKDLFRGSEIVRKLILILFKPPIIKTVISFINNNFKAIIALFGVSVNGQIFFAHTFDRITALFLLKFGMLEKNEMDIVRKTVKKGWTALDIGANIGYYSLLLSKLVGKNGKVIAFEPDKKNVKILKKNIKTNNIRNVKVVSVAVSNYTGDGLLFISDSHSGDHRIYRSMDEKRKTQNIKTISLDDYFKSSEINFIKIDVQGAEELVFKGMKRLLNDNKKICILLEFWPEGLEKIGSSPRDFLQMIKDFGFTLRQVDKSSGRLIKISIDSCLKICRGGYDTNLFLIR